MRTRYTCNDLVTAILLLASAYQKHADEDHDNANRTDPMTANYLRVSASAWSAAAAKARELASIFEEAERLKTTQ